MCLLLVGSALRERNAEHDGAAREDESDRQPPPADEEGRDEQHQRRGRRQCLHRRRAAALHGENDQHEVAGLEARAGEQLGHRAPWDVARERQGEPHCRSDARANEKVGSNGGSNMPNGAMRTAEGVQAFASDVIQRLQYFLEIFIDLIYIPVLEMFLELLHDHLTVEQVNEILTAEEGKAYEGDITDVYNAELELDVVAGANMMAKFAAAQLAPMIIQLVSAGPVADQLEVAGKKFDYAEFITETVDMMGWDVENLIVDMTQEDLQRLQQKNVAMQRVQGDLMLQQAKHQDNLAEIDAKASGQAGVATVRSILKNHEQAAVQAVENMQTPGAQVNG